MVEQTPEGIQGWAEVVTTAAARQKGAIAGGPAPRNKSKAKAKPKSAPSSDGGNVQALEKEAKGLLAKDMQARCDFNAFKETLQPIETLTPGSTAWAQPYVIQCNDALDVLNSFRSGSDFLQKFERCVLSPESLKN